MSSSDLPRYIVAGSHPWNRVLFAERLHSLPDLAALHDFIRMLDAEGYPHAFIEHGCFRLEFTRAALFGDRLVADVKITRPSPSTSAT